MGSILGRKMDFDHVVQINPDYSVEDGPEGVYAPELLMATELDGQILDAHEADYQAQAKRQGWTLLTGLTGQYSYHGLIMHRSEMIAGDVEDYIMERPGLYVAITVETDDEDANPAGWAIAYREGE